MSRAVVLQHVAFEGPGRIVPVFRDFGIPVEVRHLYRGDEVPSDPEGMRILIVMGGPMGVADVGRSEYPFLAQEVSLLKRMIVEDRAVLGICLGAQLIAHAAGAKVYRNADLADQNKTVAEVGWAGIELPSPGGTEPIMMGLMEGAPMFHWHFDTFDLPAGGVLMASTRACRNQAFRLKRRVLGFQFHFEMDEAGIEAMLANGRQTILDVLGPAGEKMVREDTGRYYGTHRRLGDGMLRNLVQFLRLC